LLGDLIKDLKKDCENVSEDIFSEAIKQARAYITAQQLLKGVKVDIQPATADNNVLLRAEAVSTGTPTSAAS
jgi:hypothetical protein